MSGVRERAVKARNWREPMATGLAIGIGLAVARQVQEVLTPRLGLGGAALVSVLAAGLVGGAVGLLTVLLVRKS
jgi:hypothetical protein